MAITAKPSSYVRDPSHTYFPDHAYMVDEGTGTVLVDKGNASTLVNLTLGAFSLGTPDWATDSTHGPSLDFVSANSDMAAVASALGITTGYTMLIVAKSGAANPGAAQTVCGLGDSAVSDRIYSGGFDTSGRITYTHRDDSGFTYTGFTSGDVVDDAYRVFAWRLEDTSGGGVAALSVDGSAWDAGTIVDAAFNITSGNLRFGIGGRVDSTPSNPVDMRLIAAFIYSNRVFDDTDISIAYNSGDIWTGVGITNAATVNDASVTNPLVQGAAEAITGTNFKPGATAPTVTLGGVSQTVTTSTNTSLTFTVDVGTGLYNTPQDLIVTNSDAAESLPVVRNVSPVSGQAAFDIGDTLTTAAQRITAVPDLQTGAQILVTSVSGGTIADVEVFTGGDFAVYNQLVSAYTAKANNANGDGWGAVGTQAFGSSAVTETGTAASTQANNASVNASVTESRTATDAVAATVRTNGAVTETLTAVDSASSSGSIPTQSVSESGSAGATFANTAVQRMAVTETANAQDVCAAGASAYLMAVSEAGSATSTQTISKLTAVGAVTESGVASHTATTSITASRAHTETGSAISSSANTAIVAASVSEEAPASDVVANGNLVSASVSETLSSTDEVGSVLTAVSAGVELPAATVTDTVTNTAEQNVGLTEIAGPADATSGGGAIYIDGCIETGDPTDTIASVHTANVGVSESTTADDSSALDYQGAASVFESSEATDAVQVEGTILVVLEVLETAEATDLCSNYTDAEVSSVSEELNATDFVNSGRFIAEPPPGRIGRSSPPPRKHKPDKPGRERFTVDN